MRNGGPDPATALDIHVGIRDGQRSNAHAHWPRTLSLRSTGCTGVPVIVERVSCGHFETQDDAQAPLDARPELAATLDSDGNGIACERVGTGERTVVICNEALGTLVEVAKGVLNYDALDRPSHRAIEEEIAAGTCAVTDSAVTALPTPGGEGESDKDSKSNDDATLDEVTELPQTGAGTS